MSGFIFAKRRLPGVAESNYDESIVFVDLCFCKESASLSLAKLALSLLIICSSRKAVDFFRSFSWGIVCYGKGSAILNERSGGVYG